MIPSIVLSYLLAILQIDNVSSTGDGCRKVPIFLPYNSMVEDIKMRTKAQRSEGIRLSIYFI